MTPFAYDATFTAAMFADELVRPETIKPPTDPRDPAWPGHWDDTPTWAEAEYDERGDGWDR